MQQSRCLVIKDQEFSGDSVVYVMSRDQRTDDNHALILAQEYAKKHNVPLYVLFVLKKIEGRTREQYEFLIKGLEDVSSSLDSYNIPFVHRIGDALEQIPTFTQEVNAGALFFDFSPLTYARSLVKEVAKTFDGYITVVDTHNIIPAWVVSDKQEYAAHTIRTKVHRLLEKYLVSPAKIDKQHSNVSKPKSVTKKEINDFIAAIPSNGTVINFVPGQNAAKDRLEEFITNDLADYAVKRNDIAHDTQSGLSPYLHFGQISSLRVALDIINEVKQPPLLLEKAKLAEHGDVSDATEGMNALLEEMIVRKELADNFCLYSKDYQSFESVPGWAVKSLQEHENDMRDFTYSLEEWESASTHDEIWNASQQELLKSGKIHGYMRMYWAKKLLEWSASPKEALKIAIYLNDKYSIDGNDPNGYVGILWSIAGLHDRPWFERPVFGKIRYMNDSGLKRKFDVAAYIDRVSR